jgi:hypothetical protein
MGSKTKIGVRIDEDLWEAFTAWVDDKHGRTHGTTGNELEHALREYMDSDDSGAVERIEDDIASINRNTADLVKRIDRLERQAEGVEADGGGATLSTADTHTHTSRTADVQQDTDKPSGKASTAKKAAWVWNEKVPETPIVISPNAFVKWVDDAWGFGDRARDRLLRQVFDEYHALGVKAERSSTWQVVVAETEAARDDKIEDQFEDAAFVLQDDGEHVEGSDVFDALVLE